MPSTTHLMYRVRDFGSGAAGLEVWRAGVVAHSMILAEDLSNGMSVGKTVEHD